jgi:hypothetical protein
MQLGRTSGRRSRSYAAGHEGEMQMTVSRCSDRPVIKAVNSRKQWFCYPTACCTIGAAIMQGDVLGT